MTRPLTVITHMLLTRGVPPPTSYWVGASREELAAAIAARRPVQACGETSHGIAWDNSMQAEQSMRSRLALCKARAAQRRAEAERLRGR